MAWETQTPHFCIWRGQGEQGEAEGESLQEKLHVHLERLCALAQRGRREPSGGCQEGRGWLRLGMGFSQDARLPSSTGGP